MPEVVALKVGEPFGTVILAVAVTVIETSLILSMMLSGTANPALPRDTVFAAIMLILNGLVVPAWWVAACATASSVSCSKA